MTIYLLTEEAVITDFITKERERKRGVIQAFTDKRLAEEIMEAKQRIYDECLLDHMQIASQYTSDPFSSHITPKRSAMISPEHRTKWYLQEVELTTDKFTKFALGDK